MTSTPAQADVRDLAARLMDAEAKRAPIAALTTTCGPFDVATAYQVQDAVLAARVLDGGQPLDCGRLIQPRCEPEIAFLMSRDLAGPQVTAARAGGPGRRGPAADRAQVFIAGALTEAVPVAPGDTVVAHFDRLGTVEPACR